MLETVTGDTCYPLKTFLVFPLGGGGAAGTRLVEAEDPTDMPLTCNLTTEINPAPKESTPVKGSARASLHHREVTELLPSFEIVTVAVGSISLELEGNRLTVLILHGLLRWPLVPATTPPNCFQATP